MEQPRNVPATITPNFNPNARMSSKDIAELTDKIHGHVMRDIRQLIEEDAITESGFGLSKYKDSTGKMNNMYLLDFQATMTLVTGYDAKRRALVIDRWIKLETGEAKPALLQSPPFTAQAMAREFRAYKSIALTAGLKGNEAVLRADKAVKQAMGQSPLALIDATHLVAAKQQRHLTATEVGYHLGLRANGANKALEAAGLQSRVMGTKHWYWAPTELGKPHCVLLDTGKRHSDGTSVQQLKWLESVLEVVTTKRKETV